MKERSTQDTASRSNSAAENVSQTRSQTSQSYQINDRRAASVMQRKFRNLANGLASANIIQPKASFPNIEAKPSAINQDVKESE